jgi:hypothetical protein
LFDISIEQFGKLLKLRIYHAQHLPVMDSGILGGKCDPYVVAEFAGIKIKTPKRLGLDVDFYTELQIPVMEPIMSTQVRLTVWDHDVGSSDDRIATVNLDYNEIKSNKGIPPRWYTLMGAPHGKQKNNSSKMNRGYIPGSCYRGKNLKIKNYLFFFDNNIFFLYSIFILYIVYLL